MTRKNEVVTGIFVLLGLALVVVGSMWMSGARFRSQDRVLIAHFQNVGLVKPGNSVTLRGVDVGKVSRVTLGDVAGVEVELRVDDETPLPPQPVVVLQPVSLFGGWQAVIVPASERPELDLDSLDLPPGRIPGITLADFSELSESSALIAKNLQSLTDRFQIAFNENTARDLARSIENFSLASEELVALLARQREDFGEFTSNLAEAGVVVRQAATDLSTTVSRLASATDEGQFTAIFDNARDASGSLKEVSAELRGTVSDMDRTIARADSAVREAQSLFRSINRGEGSIGLLARNVELYENTVAAMSELRALLDDLKHNPRKYFNFSVF